MSNTNKRQFGVWMDSHNATIVGKENDESSQFAVIGHVKNDGAANNSNENSSNNHEIALMQKFFKEIAAKMQNADEIHLTGTGQIQEQFKKFLNETPQYKTADATESTSNKMSDESFLEFVNNHFN
jgi:stalled ribosome rescue protein Dom34